MKKKFFNEKEGAYIAKIRMTVLVSNILSAVAICIYTFLPNSEFANSLDVPAKNALWVLTISPVLAGIATLLYAIMLLKNLPKGSGMIKAQVASVVYLLSSVFIFIGALAYTINQWSLGFVAPTYDTIFESIKIAMQVACLCQVIFGTLILKTK